MLYINSFKNYDDFKEIFGVEQRANGVKTRKNKILLAHLKSRSMLKYVRRHPQYANLLAIRNINDLEVAVFSAIQECGSIECKYAVQLMGKIFRSSAYTTDDWEGICEDGDHRSVRYVKVDADRVYKMKAGKFMTQIMNETSVGQALAPQVITYLAGDVFTQKWEAYTRSRCPECKLHVDYNFKDIYDSGKCAGSFDSCMTDKERHEFFENSITCQAAYLTNKDGIIICRAILYNEVTDENGDKWRLLERQYASDNGGDTLKRMLVDQLIAAGHIDGYKAIGASCHESRNFVDIHGNSLAEHTFSINCGLRMDEILSYADSFKYYNFNEGVAYNNSHCCYDYDLATTEPTLDGEYTYDEYNEMYSRNTREVHYNGSWIYVDEDHLEDFIYVEAEGEYYHEDEVTRCEQCDEYFVTNNGYYSDLTDECYCSHGCQLDAERDYKTNNWYFSEWDDEYYENADDVLTVQKYNYARCEYEEITISRQSFSNLMNDGSAIDYEDILYIGYDSDTCLPYGIEQTAEIAA